MKPNRLRQLLKEGKPTLGTHLICPWPGLVEIVGYSGMFDYIEYVGEYSPFSLEQMDNFGRTIELFPEMSSMMKVEEHTRGFIATRAIDSGMQNVLFTDIRSVEDAKDCVRIVRSELPEVGGTHGVGMRRGVGYVLGAASPEWVQSMNDVVIALMVEKKGAMDNLEQILQVPGIDMVQFGPSDYSISVGLPGQSRGDKVQGDQKRMIQMALEAGVHPRVEIGSFEQAQPWIDMGVRHFCIGWDLTTLFQWCKTHGGKMREMVGAATTASTSSAIGYTSAG